MSTKLATAFEIINGEPVEKVMATLGRLADRDARSALGLVRNGSRTGINGGAADVFNCPKGGELLDTQGENPVGRFSHEIEAIDCAIAARVLADGLISSASSAMRPGGQNAALP